MAPLTAQQAGEWWTVVRDILLVLGGLGVVLFLLITRNPGSMLMTLAMAMMGLGVYMRGVKNGKNDKPPVG